jgi:chromosome segregation ATPase
VDKGGEVSTENANKIVADAERQIKLINELPATERAAFADRIKLYQGFIDQYTAATSKFQEQTEKEAQAAEELSKREIAALKKVEEEREKANAKKLESLQKNLDAAQKDADKGGGDGPSDKAIGNTKELTKEAEKLKGQIADINAKPLITVEDENLLDSYRSTLHDLNDQLGKSSDSFGAIDRASNAAGERLAAVKDAENALNTELNKQGEIAQENNIAQAVAETQYNKNEIAVTKLADGTLKFSNISEDQELTVKRNAAGFLELSDAQGDVQKSQADLNALMDKYGPSSKAAADSLKDHLEPALDRVHAKLGLIEERLPKVIGLFNQLADVAGSGGGSGGGF